MNWITNFVKPKLKALVSKEIPDNLWDKCPACEQMIFHRELTDKLFVCPYCDHHLRLTAQDRLKFLYDEGIFERHPLPDTLKDPLKFKDLKKYTDRLKEAKAATNEEDALVIGIGCIGGKKAVCAAFDFRFMGGSMGLTVGDGLIAAARLAIHHKTVLIVIPASGGARMQEGILSLMQMARTTAAINELKEAGLPYIVLLTDPTSGGVTASFAMLGDITVAEPKATICFTGRRVIEQTIKQKLPKDFQTAEYLKNKGMIDQVIHRRDLNKRLGNIINLLKEKVIPQT